MTWTESDIKKVCKSAKVYKNHKQFYKKYNHKLIFVFKTVPNTTRLYGIYSSYNHNLAYQLRTAFAKKSVVFKATYNYYNTIYYVQDLDAALNAIPRNLKKYCDEVHVMNPVVADFYENFSSNEYKTVLTVKNNLPYDRYRYRVNFSNSTKKYRGIDEQQLESAARLLKGYNGLMFPPDFEERLKGTHLYYSGAPYFYAENLDWLSMFLLATPRIIHSIEMFKTESEIKQGEPINEH